MSLVTAENVNERPGWKVTPMGRIIRPVRIRPEHPLGEPLEVKKVKRKLKDDGKGDDKGEEKKKRKKREKQPDTRARRKTIDPTRWGSVHLKGMFLEVHDTGERPKTDMNLGYTEKEDEESEESDTSDEEEVDSKQVVEPPIPIPIETKTSLVPASTVPAAPAPTIEPVTIPTPVLSLPAVTEDDGDITMEKTKTLDLLNSLFGGKEWGGQESVGSDVDEEELTKGMQIQVDAGEDDEIEEVPMDVDVVDNAVETEEEESEEEESVEAVPEKHQEPPTVKQQQATKLKDLFAPREDEGKNMFHDGLRFHSNLYFLLAGFSLLGHLDLDLELDDEIIFEEAPEIQDAPPSHLAAATSSVNVYAPSTSAPHNLTLDPRQPLFFPLASSFPTSTTSWMSTNARSRDLFDVARENGWNWRDENVGFWRTGTEEDIRKRWEGEKVELTREWKRRCREAGKIRRRRGAGVDAE